MPLAKTGSPKSAYDYDQEGKQEQQDNEFKSPEAEDRDVRASMKALRLLDQSKVRSTEEVDRNLNANAEALKLLDEVTLDESHKPPATIMPGMDLSPKQYDEQEEYKEGDDILVVDDIKRYKRAEYVAREFHSKNKALNLLDESFGQQVQPSYSKNSTQPVAISTRTQKPSKKQPDLSVPKLAKDIVRDHQSKKKALKLVDQSWGAEVTKSSQPPHSKKAKSTSPRAPANVKPWPAVASDASLSPRQSSFQQAATLSPRSPTLSSRSATSSDTDLSPKQYTGQEDSDEGSGDADLRKYKRAENIAREHHSKKKALKLIDDSFGGEAKQKYKKLEDMATSTRKKKTRVQDLPNPDTVAGMKGDYDQKLERSAEEKALKMVNSASLVRRTHIV